MVLKSGYHVNSNTPSESYLIPLRLTWEPGILEAVEVVFPKPHMEKYEFSQNPLSVFTGDFELVTKFQVAANASSGPGMALGKLRYQACNNNSCLPPKTVEIKAGQEVQFINNTGGAAHVWFAGNDALKFYVGKEVSRIMFDKPGTYEYTVHASGIKVHSHTGSVVVK